MKRNFMQSKIVNQLSIAHYPLSIVNCALLIVFCLFFGGTVWGQSTLTVYGDNTTTNEYVPIYGYYADEISLSQFIIPSSDLSGMASGSIISKLTFYSSNENVSWGNAKFEVYMTEVSYTVFSSANMTWVGKVKNANSLQINNYQMIVELDDPYIYMGGNLLIGVKETYSGSWVSAYWYGVNKNAYTAIGNEEYSGSRYELKQFLPKTTFTYTIPTTPFVTLSPSSATVLTGFTQSLTATYGNVSGTPSITYTSSNTSVATVSGSGTSATVTAVAPGTCTITATMTYNNNTYTATCAITVEDPSYCTPGTGNYDNNGIYNVTFGANPSVNNTVAGIDYGDYSNLVGKVSAGANCQVDITYKTGYTYGTIIWVDWNQNYIFEGTEAVYAGESGDANPTTLNATFTVPANASAGDYRMRIIGSDMGLDSYTGSLSVAANADPCGSYNYSTCHDYTLRVSSDPSISLNPTTLNLSPGSTATLTATKVNDGGATITWSSSNTGVATVSGSGTSATVTAVRDGTATITASMTVNGVTYSATCDVTVESCGTIGTGTSADNRVPINTYYNYFTTQSLYTASEINAAIGSNNLINSLSFYHNEYSATYSISIYLAHTTQTALSASSAVTSATLVYSGSSITVGGNAAGWQTFDLDTPFEYNGTDNLFVIVCGSGSYNTSLYWQYTTTSSSAPSLSRGDDNTSGYADLSNTSYSYSTYSYRPNIKICGTSSGAYTITCATPSHGTLSADRNNADENDVVTITATPETDYLLTALTYTPEGGSAQNIDITSMPYTFTMPAANVTVNATFSLPACPKPTNVTVSNLAPSRATVSWESNAGNYTVRYSTATVTGTTLDPIFEDGFENGLGSWTIYAMGYDDPVYNWIQYDGTIVDEGNHTGDYVAASRSWHGSNGDQSVDNWLVTPQMTLGDAVRFWVACNNDFRDSYAVYVSTGSNVVTSSSSIGDFVLVKSYAEATGTWTEIPVDISAYAGQQGYVAIRHTNYGGDHIMVDDFGVYNTINTYSYEGWTTVSPNPTTESCQITGLSAETLYAVQVQANCGGSDGSSAWSTIYFTTPDNCGAPQELASSNITSTTAALAWADDKESYNLRYRKVYYYEDFESSDGIPAGWTTINNSSTAGSLNWQVMHMTNHSGNNSLGSGSYIYQNSGITPDNWLISPQLDLQGTLRVWLSGYPSAGDRYREHFEILLSTTGTSVSDFTTTLVGETTTTSSYVEYTADLSSYSGQGYIAIHHFNCSDQNYLCVDDFGLYGSENWVNLSPNPTTETANLTSLTPGTTYEWQVQGINCDGSGGLTSWSATSNFTTLCSIAASVSPDESGSITGAGDYAWGNTCTLTATADDCYNFVNWTENGTQVSTNATYSFTVTGNRTLVANFTLNNYSVTVDAGEGGTASQEGNGTYDCGSIARLTATPDACYNFSYWTDGNGGTFAGFNPIEITVDHDITFTAHFTLKTYTITTVASPNAGGSVTQSGNGTYNCGSDATLTATPSSGYYFYQWNDGNTDNPRTINNITSNVTYTATFKQAPLIINNTTDWNNFAEAVSHGYTYSGETVTQTADITVTTMVGGVNAAGVYDENFYFNGIFNGGCNTITFTKANATEQYTAPFRRINGATIQNVKVAGTVSSSNRFAGGVVAYAKGTSTVTNCINSTSITSNGNTHGGIVGMVGGSGTINITGCVFDGTMSNGTDWSGILGLCNSTCTANISNCLFIPASVSVSSTFGTIHRSTGTTNLSNCYYTQTMNTLQGTRAYSVTGGTGVEVSMQGSASTTYSCSGLNFYTSGLTFNGTIYGSSLALSLGYEGLISGYTTSSGELSGTSHTGVNDEYTLASLSDNAVINQNPCPFDNPPAGLIWKGGTAGDITNWAVATNWAVYNEGESRYQLAGSAPSESSDVFIVSNDACNIVGVPSLSSNEECNDITLNGIGVNIADGKYLTVNGTATFTSGIVTGDVIFDAAGSAEGANINSYVDGTVTKNGNDASFIFPTGSDGVLGTITASIASGQSATAKFNHKSGGFDQEHDGYPRWWNAADMCGGDPFNHISNFEYWNFNTTANLTNVTFESKAASADAHFHDPSEYPTSSDGDIIQIAVYNNCWQNIGGHLEMSDENRTITISGVNATRGTTRSGSMITSLGSKSKTIVLPIELTSFTATCDGRSTLVEWSTATERNNDYFVIERSDDAIEFTEVGRVAGAGNSIEQLDYTYNDYGIHGGDNYYRLVQVDYDGTRTVSEIVVANCVESATDGDPDVLAYPNPFNGELTLVLDNFSNRAATIEVYDMLGKLIYTEKASAPQNSYETILNLSNLPSGAYTVRVSTNDFVINRNVVKQ
ncbi:MAG: choice-of-anchor J domain-containing protein [Bacteroidales bacterium]|nr:choice-of-anchor J domain-containing protein [Bacteroidales bacterium]